MQRPPVARCSRTAWVKASACSTFARWAAPSSDVESCTRNPRRDELGVLDRGRRVVGAGDDEHGRGDRGDPLPRVPGADGFTAARVPLRRRRREHRAEARDRLRLASRENSGVNQRPTTVSAIAPIPSARTVRARCAHASGGPRYADVQARTSRSTRSGASSASAIPTIPPSETPQNETRSRSSSSRSSSRSVRQRLDRARPLGEVGRAVAGVVVGEDAEALRQLGELPIPQLLRGAERVGQDEDVPAGSPWRRWSRLISVSSRTRPSARSTSASAAPR